MCKKAYTRIIFQLIFYRIQNRWNVRLLVYTTKFKSTAGESPVSRFREEEGRLKNSRERNLQMNAYSCREIIEYSIVQNRSILKSWTSRLQERPKINFGNFGTLVLRSIVRQSEMILSKSYAKPPLRVAFLLGRVSPESCFYLSGVGVATLQSRPRLVTNPRRSAPEVMATERLWLSVLSLIHIWRCRRSYACRSRWSPYH